MLLNAEQKSDVL